MERGLPRKRETQRSRGPQGVEALCSKAASIRGRVSNIIVLAGHGEPSATKSLGSRKVKGGVEYSMERCAVSTFNSAGIAEHPRAVT